MSVAIVSDSCEKSHMYINKGNWCKLTMINSSQAKRVVLYLARSRPERLLDEMMTELQTVETLNCLIERTETPPFYRLTSMRKATSGHSDGPGTGSQVIFVVLLYNLPLFQSITVNNFIFNGYH